MASSQPASIADYETTMNLPAGGNQQLHAYKSTTSSSDFNVFPHRRQRSRRRRPNKVGSTNSNPQILRYPWNVSPASAHAPNVPRLRYNTPQANKNHSNKCSKNQFGPVTTTCNQCPRSRQNPNLERIRKLRVTVGIILVSMCWCTGGSTDLTSCSVLSFHRPIYRPCNVLTKPVLIPSRVVQSNPYIRSMWRLRERGELVKAVVMDKVTTEETKQKRIVQIIRIEMKHVRANRVH